jgi:ABC-type molybdate transport system substrate-binding protein
MKLPRRRFVHLAAYAAVPLVLLVQCIGAGAAEIRVLSAGAARQPQHELFSQFERATGHKIVTEFDFNRRQLVRA